MTYCRACRKGELVEVADLGPMPLANALDSTELLPLHLMFCERCAAVQIAETVEAERLFGGDYAYHSSVNYPYVEQEHRLVDRLVKRLGLGPDDLVAEVGSNDGYLLDRYVEHGVGVVGFEPAANLAEIADRRGVRTVRMFLGQGKPPGAFLGRCSVVHANNVLAHVPDVDSVLRSVEQLLAPDGLLIVETPYLRSLVDHVQWDTIYHEHIFYWSLLAFSRACRRAGLSVIDVERIPSHCGSMRVTVTRSGYGWPTDRVGQSLFTERMSGMHRAGYYAELASAIDRQKADCRQAILEYADLGLVAGFGAAAKGTVLLNGLGLPAGTIAYVVDDTPYKQGRAVPGCGVPIVAASELVERPPAAVVVLAWNYAAEIIAAHPEVADGGGVWIVPNEQPVPVAA